MKKDYSKTNPEFWRTKMRSKCKICGGTGRIRIGSDGTAIELCICERMAPLFAKMHDPVHGLRPQYHKWSLDIAACLSKATKENIKKYFEEVSKEGGNPYRNLIIKGDQGAGKSSVAAIIYKFLMSREYSVSIFNFSEIVGLSRMHMSNSSEYNNRAELTELLKIEDFIIVEDVDSRGHPSDPNHEKIGYTFLNEIFAYRALHPEKATIFTMDKGLDISESTLGKVFYHQIYHSDVEDGKVIQIGIKTVSK